MYDAIALGIILVTNTVLGATVLSRNIKNKINRLYTLLAITVMCWTTANYFTNHVHGHVTQLIVNRVSFALGLILAAVVWVFSLYFPKKIAEHNTQRRIAYILLPIAVALSSTSFIVNDVIYRPEKALTDVTTGSLYLIYVFTALIFFTFLFINFHQAFKSKATGVIERQQIVYSAIGILLTFVWILLTTAVIPSITNDWGISKIGIIGSLFLVTFIGYAIIRHKLFDIRLIVARSIAYILSLGSMVAIFTAITYATSNIIFRNNLNTSATRWLYTLLAIILAFVFPKLKQFFDRVTNKYFYRDAYDLKAAIDGFSGVLVASINLGHIIEESRKLFNSTVRPQYSNFLLSGSNKTIEMGQKNTTNLTEEEQKDIKSLMNKYKTSILIADNLLDEEDDTKRVLTDKNISVVVKLETTDGNVGLIILGPKLTGSIYNSQDISFLTIVGKELALAIQNALRFEEIQQFNVTLQEKIDDATHQLRKANDRLKALDETKDEFISMASHQLRTPLTSVKGYVSMVLEGDGGKVTSPQKKLLDQAFMSSQRMVYLIADLLNVSRLRTGKFVIDAQPTNLADLVEGEISQLAETAKGRGLELTYNKPKDFPILMLDETKTRQVIMNFADNAIYYTPNGGHISVNLVETPESVELTVVDDGLGVPKHDQHHMFTKFYRASNAKKARPDGTGLGLFMAKKVIIAQGGAIIFKSEEGKGSTFGFSFPKAKLKVSGVVARTSN